jgi:protein regulator of cytokinesis 1
MSDWNRFKDQLDGHYAKLRALHAKLGGEQHDSAATIMHVVEAALEASLQATRDECEAVRRDCEAMQADMRRMRMALGETTRLQGLDDPFSGSTTESSIKAPLLQSQKLINAEWQAVKRAFLERAEKVVAMYQRLQAFVGLVPQHIINLPIPPLDGEDPPEDVSLLKLGQIEAALSRCSREIQNRKRQVQQYGKEIILLWAELAVETSQLSSQLDQQIMLDSESKPELLGLTDEALSVLEQKRDALLLQKQERAAKIEACTATVRVLHAKLKLHPQELSIFLSRTRGASQVAVEHCERELERLAELKKDHIEEFVRESRMELEALWDRLLYGEEQRLQFAPFFAAVYTDASLLAHEHEISRIEKILEEQTPLLSLIEQHMQLNSERQELAALSSNPNRFRERGYNPMAESKLRTKVEKRMPKIESALREALVAYEEHHREPFLVWGEIYLDKDTAADASTAALSSSTGARPKSVGTAISVPPRPRPRTPGATLARPTTTASATPATTQRTLPSGRNGTSRQNSAGHSSSSSNGPTVRVMPVLSRSVGTPIRPTDACPQVRPSNTDAAAVRIRTTTQPQPNSIKARAIPHPHSNALKERTNPNTSKIPGPATALQKPTMLPLYTQPSDVRKVSSTSVESDATAAEQSHDYHEAQRETAGTDATLQGKPERTRFSFRPVMGIPFVDGPEPGLHQVVEASFEDGWGEEGF